MKKPEKRKTNTDNKYLNENNQIYNQACKEYEEFLPSEEEIEEIIAKKHYLDCKDAVKDIAKTIYNRIRGGMSKHTSEQIKDWKEYEKVRLEGRYNMYSSNARLLTGLSKEEYSYCIKNYTELKNQAISKAEGGLK